MRHILLATVLFLAVAQTSWAGPEMLLSAMARPPQLYSFDSGYDGWVSDDSTYLRQQSSVNAYSGAGAVVYGGTSTPLSLTKTVSTNTGNITFWLRTPTASALGGYVQLLIDGTDSPLGQCFSSTSNVYRQFTVAVTKGTHTLRFAFADVSGGIVYLDEVVVP